jgi:hypothetical protein
LKLVLDADVYVLGLQPSAGHALVPRREVPSTSGPGLRKPKTQTQPSPRVGASNHLNHNGRISTPNPPVRVGQKSSSGEDALIEMINMTIVDRSPAVKWDDVGKNCFNSSLSDFFIIWSCILNALKPTNINLVP